MNNNSANDPIFVFDEQLTNAIKKSLPSIGVALNRISVNIEKYAHDNDIEHEMDEIFNGNTDIYDWADSFSEQEKKCASSFVLHREAESLGETIH